MIVYLIRCKLNGKCYVGKTSQTLAGRWRQHRTEARICRRIGHPLYKDMRLHGFENFEVMTLGQADNSREINRLERHFIEVHGASNGGYNSPGLPKGAKRKYRRGTDAGPLPPDHRRKIARSVARAWAERKGVA